MTIKYEFTPNGTIAWLEGVITGEDLVQVNKTVYTHEYSGEHTFHLIVMSEDVEFGTSMSLLEGLADIDRRESQTRELFCCVVAPTDFTFGMTRAWGAYSDDDNFHNRAVRSLEEAIVWLESNGIDASILKNREG